MSGNNGYELPRIAMTPVQAAKSAGVSRTRIFQAIKHGKLMARKDGKSTIIETKELVRWVESLPIRDWG